MPFLSSVIVAYVLLVLIPIVAISLALPYLALRLRDSREEKRDPELGVKSAYYLFLSAAILLMLLGLTVSAIDVMDGVFDTEKKAEREKARNLPQPKIPVAAPRNDVDKELSERAQRTGWALVVSGLLFSLVIIIVIKSATNDVEFPAAKRVFVDGRLGLSGVVTMIAITTFIVLLFQKEGKNVPDRTILSMYETATAVTMVWLPATIVHMVLMRIYAAQPYHVEQSPRGRRPERPHVDEQFDVE